MRGKSVVQTCLFIALCWQVQLPLQVGASHHSNWTSSGLVVEEQRHFRREVESESRHEKSVNNHDDSASIPPLPDPPPLIRDQNASWHHTPGKADPRMPMNIARESERNQNTVGHASSSSFRLSEDIEEEEEEEKAILVEIGTFQAARTEENVERIQREEHELNIHALSKDPNFHLPKEKEEIAEEEKETVQAGSFEAARSEKTPKRPPDREKYGVNMHALSNDLNFHLPEEEEKETVLDKIDSFKTARTEKTPQSPLEREKYGVNIHALSNDPNFHLPEEEEEEGDTGLDKIDSFQTARTEKDPQRPLEREEYGVNIHKLSIDVGSGRDEALKLVDTMGQNKGFVVTSNDEESENASTFPLKVNILELKGSLNENALAVTSNNESQSTPPPPPFSNLESSENNGDQNENTFRVTSLNDESENASTFISHVKKAELGGSLDEEALAATSNDESQNEPPPLSKLENHELDGDQNAETFRVTSNEESENENTFLSKLENTELKGNLNATSNDESQNQPPPLSNLQNPELDDDQNAETFRVTSNENTFLSKLEHPELKGNLNEEASTVTSNDESSEDAITFLSMLEHSEKGVTNHNKEALLSTAREEPDHHRSKDERRNEIRMEEGDYSPPPKEEQEAVQSDTGLSSATHNAEQSFNDNIIDASIVHGDDVGDNDEDHDDDDDDDEKSHGTELSRPGQQTVSSSTRGEETLVQTLAQLLKHVSNGTPLKRVRRDRDTPDGWVLPTSLSEISVDANICNCGKCGHDRVQTGSFENVAVNRHVVHSSTGSGSLRGCGAVNGDSNPEYIPNTKKWGANCFKTSEDDHHAWWRVDLTLVLTFDAIVLTRTEGVTGAMRLSGVDILVDAVICHRFHSYNYDVELEAMPDVQNITCGRPVTGRIVRFVKRNEPVRGDGHILGFCEMKIYVCSPGTYGSYYSGCKECQDKCFDTCDNFYGCTEIPVFDVAVTMAVSVSSIETGQPKSLTDLRFNPYYPESWHGCFKTQDSMPGPDSSSSSGGRSFHWVTVQLGISYRILQVRIRSRPVAFCTKKELTKFFVSVTNSQAPEVIDQDFNIEPTTICHYARGSVPNDTMYKMDCNRLLHGHYVHITKFDQRGLGLCSVEVVGYMYFLLEIGARCNKNSRMVSCMKESTCEKGSCKVKAGFPCRRRRDCVIGSSCTYRVCLYDYNETCNFPHQHCAKDLACDEHNNRCKYAFEAACETNDRCAFNDTCDHFKVCRGKTGTACHDSRDCAAGAFCKDGMCWCNSAVSTQTDEACAPKPTYIGAVCHGNSNCASNWCVNHQCVCPEDKPLYHPDFSCIVKVGDPCQEEANCSTKLTCDEELCKLKPGENCRGNEQACARNTTCIDQKCQFGMNKYCGHVKGSYCHHGVCSEGDGHICKPGAGDKCLQTVKCQTGLVCAGNVCKVPVGGNCALEPSFCAAGHCSVDDGSKCKLDAGDKCSAAVGEGGLENHCHKGAVCDGSICVMKPGEPCKEGGGGARAYCKRGAHCTGLGICKISLGEDCSQFPQHCIKGSCSEKDNVTCKLEVGEGCGVGNERYHCERRTQCGTYTSKRICMYKLYAPCAKRKDQCTEGICSESDSWRCKIDIGKSCQISDSCVIKGTCYQNICKIKMSEPCNKADSTHCITGSVCTRRYYETVYRCLNPHQQTSRMQQSQSSADRLLANSWLLLSTLIAYRGA